MPPGGGKDFPGGKAIDTVITCDCDVLLPCAMEHAIKPHNAQDIRARLIVEGANGPTTKEADDILGKRGIAVVPDILANDKDTRVPGHFFIEGFVLR